MDRGALEGTVRVLAKSQTASDSESEARISSCASEVVGSAAIATCIGRMLTILYTLAPADYRIHIDTNDKTK